MDDDEALVLLDDDELLLENVFLISSLVLLDISLIDFEEEESLFAKYLKNTKSRKQLKNKTSSKYELANCQIISNSFWE